MTMHPLTISAGSARSPCRTTSWYQAAKSALRRVMGDCAIEIGLLCPHLPRDCGGISGAPAFGDFAVGHPEPFHRGHGKAAAGRRRTAERLAECALLQVAGRH